MEEKTSYWIEETSHGEKIFEDPAGWYRAKISKNGTLLTAFYNHPLSDDEADPYQCIKMSLKIMDIDDMINRLISLKDIILGNSRT